MKSAQTPFPWLAVWMLLFAGGICILSADADFIVLDELFSFGNMGGFSPAYSPLKIIESLGRYSPDHTPLWYILSAGMAHLTGWSQVALRLFSILTALLMLAVLYRFAAEAVNRRSALAALFLMSTTSFVLPHLYYIRMYPLLMLLAIAHCWLYWRLMWSGRAARLAWLLFPLTAAALLYTHVFGAFLLGGLALNHLLFTARTRAWRRVIAAWAGAGLLFLPYLPILVDGLHSNLDHSITTSLLDGVLKFAVTLVNRAPVLWLPLLLALGYALRKKPNAAVIAILRIGLLGCVPLLLLKLVFDVLPLTRTHYFLVLWFAFVIPLGYAIAGLPRAFCYGILLVWGIVFAVDFPASGVPLDSTYRLDRPAVLGALADTARPGDIIISAFDKSVVNTRRRKHGYSAVDFYLRQLGIDSAVLRPREERAQIDADLRALAAAYPHFLLAHNPQALPPDFAYTLSLLERDYLPCALLIDSPAMRVQRYVSRAMDCGHQPQPAAYTNGITLLDRSARHLPAEEQLQITVWLETADARQPQQFNVSWQVISADWQNLQQLDRHLYAVLPWSVQEMSTAGLPPGDYRLLMILYDRHSGEKVSYRVPETGALEKYLPLLDFSIDDEGGGP